MSCSIGLLNDDSVFNFNSTINFDALKVMGTFSFHVPLHEKDLEYQKEVIKSTVNMCKLEQGVRANFIMKMIMENFNKCANFKWECPMKTGIYTLTNFTITDSAIPSYLIPQDLKFMLLARVMCKVPKSKALEYFYTVKMYGELKKE
jgi:Protein of unknown function (DUF1091)